MPILSLICLAMVKKACSTFVALLADVSKKGIESPSANSFATVYSTTFLSAMSLLLPTSSLFTPSVAYRSISCSHCLTFAKVSHLHQRRFCAYGRMDRSPGKRPTLICNVVYDDNSMCSSVVRRRNRPESLLTGGVPLHDVSALRSAYVEHRTICNLTVLPSSSMVLIFFARVSHRSVSGLMRSQSPLR